MNSKREQIEKIEKLVVILITPSSYETVTGYNFVNRFYKGVLPSNGLVIMNSLTKAAVKTIKQKPQFSDLEIEIHMFDDGVWSDSRELSKLEKRFSKPKKDTKLVVGLVSVQTRQFPHACDIMDRWQKLGATCVIGGFHVSGSISSMLDGISATDKTRPNIPCPHIMPPEIQALMDKGIIVFHGEAEDQWINVLLDILKGSPNLLYRGGRPSIIKSPLPAFNMSYIKKFAVRTFTLETSRGCPQGCDFCTLINVYGRKVRSRGPQYIIEFIRDVCEQQGFASVFFVDDNFVRNKDWQKIFDGIISLREQGYNIRGMLEADLLCGKEPNFIEKAAKAGITQFFMGAESMDRRNLKAARKNQNHVEQYRELWQTVRDNGMAAHIAYMIGFAYDTAESVKEAIDLLIETGADQVSLFIVTPLPGAENHVRAYCAGTEMHKDFNLYDSFQPVWKHQAAEGIRPMREDEWQKAYNDSWKQVYSIRNMVKILRRHKAYSARKHLFKNFVWYRWSVFTEKSHPMVAGLYRFHSLKDRRPGSKPLSFFVYSWNQTKRHFRYLGCFFKEFYIFEHVFFETEVVPYLSERQMYLTGKVNGFGDWLKRTFYEPMNRRWLNRFWIEYGKRKWELLYNWYWHLRMIPYALTKVVYTFRWGYWFYHNIVKSA